MITLHKVVRATFNAASKMLHVNTVGAGDEGDDASAEAVQDAPLLGMMGITVKPVVAKTLRAAMLYLGVTEQAVLALWDKAKQPTDLADGETRVWAAGFPAVCLRLFEGFIELKAGAAGVVKLAPDGSGWQNKNVARVDDTVNAGSLVITVGAFGPGFSLVFTYTPPGGAPQVTTVNVAGLVTGAAIGAPTLSFGGQITSGSSSVKA